MKLRETFKEIFSEKPEEADKLPNPFTDDDDDVKN